MNAPSHDEMGKLSVFMKTASEEDLECLSKSDSFCAEVLKNKSQYTLIFTQYRL